MSKYKAGDKFVIEIKGETDGIPGAYWVENNLTATEAWLDKLRRLEDVIKDELEKARQEGAEEAWKVAKKIVVVDGGFAHAEREKIFGTPYIDTVFNQNSFYLAKMKIEKWKEENEEVHVGDIVEYPIDSENPCEVYVTSVQEEGGVFYGFNIDSGGVYANCFVSDARKTGRHMEWDRLREVLKE